MPKFEIRFKLVEEIGQEIEAENFQEAYAYAGGMCFSYANALYSRIVNDPQYDKVEVIVREIDDRKEDL